MAIVTLTLAPEGGKAKTFQKNRVTARWLMEAYKLAKEIDPSKEKNDVIGILDARINFTVAFFDDEGVTRDTILDGLSGDELITALDGVYNGIIGATGGDEDEPGNE